MEAQPSGIKYLHFNTLQEAQNACPEEGTVVETKGFREPGDGGAATYTVKTGGPVLDRFEPLGWCTTTACGVEKGDSAGLERALKTIGKLIIPEDAGEIKYDNYRETSRGQVIDERFQYRSSQPERYTQQLDIGARACEQGLSMVVTGDSLSGNVCDYPAPNDEFNYWKCAQGLKSWGFLLRDAFIAAHPTFVSASDLLYNAFNPYTYSHTRVHPEGIGRGGTAWMNDISANSGDVMCLSFPDENDDILISYSPPVVNNFRQGNISPYGGKITDLNLYLYIQHPLFAVEPCVFEVSTYYDRRKIGSARIANSVSGEEGQVKAYPITDFKDDEISSMTKTFHVEIKRVEKAVEFRSLMIVGMSQNEIRFVNTGRGGLGTAQLLDDFDMRIARHKPDLLFIIITINDFLTEAALIYSKFDALIEKCVQLKPMDIVLITPPYDLGNPLPGLDTPQFAEFETSVPTIHRWILHRLARKYNLNLLDLGLVFRNIPIEKWRFDNIHINRYGNEVIFKSILKEFAPSLIPCVERRSIGQCGFSSEASPTLHTSLRQLENYGNMRKGYLMVWSDLFGNFIDCGKSWNISGPFHGMNGAAAGVLKNLCMTVNADNCVSVSEEPSGGRGAELTLRAPFLFTTAPCFEITGPYVGEPTGGEPLVFNCVYADDRIKRFAILRYGSKGLTPVSINDIKIMKPGFFLRLIF